MRTTTDLSNLLGDYARSHRDERNIVSHFVGVPMIVFALGDLLARPGFTLAGQNITPAWIGVLSAATWYLSRGSLLLGTVAVAAIAALAFAAQGLAHLSNASWLVGGLGLLSLGWLIRSIGHWYEGHKPGRLDAGLAALVAPLFLAAEALFRLGWNPALRADIERRAGPVTLRDLARIA